jgi:hypothetical protein
MCGMRDSYSGEIGVESVFNNQHHLANYSNSSIGERFSRRPWTLGPAFCRPPSAQVQHAYAHRATGLTPSYLTLRIAWSANVDDSRACKQPNAEVVIESTWDRDPIRRSASVRGERSAGPSMTVTHLFQVSKAGLISWPILALLALDTMISTA